MSAIKSFSSIGPLRKDPFKGPYGVLLLLLLYFVILPVASVILFGIFPLRSVAVIGPMIRRSLPLLGRSLLLSGGVTLTATFFGLSAALTIHRFAVPGARMLHGTFLLGMINPPFVGSLAFIMLFGRRGLITYELLGLDVTPYGWQGIFIMQCLGLTTLAYLVISGSIGKTDPAVEDAARMLGTSEFRIFREITLKTMVPEITAAATLVFLTSMADFGTPLVIGGPCQTIASDLYIQITGLYDMKSASVSGILLLLPCIGLFLFQRRQGKRKNYYSPGITEPDIRFRFYSSPLKFFLWGLTVLYSLLVIMKYGFILIGAFTEHWGYDYSLTLRHVQKVLSREMSPFINSIKLAAVTATLASATGVFLSYLIKRKNYRFRGAADLAATLPAAVPGILLGIGYLVTFKYPILGIGRFVLKSLPPLLLLGTGIIIFLICIFRYMNVGLRSGYAVLEHINPDIEQAARNLGEGEFGVFFKIVLPLAAPAFGNAFYKNFSTTMTTLGAIIFLLLPSNKVAVQSIFQIITSSERGMAAVMAIFLSALTALMLGLFKLIQNAFLGVRR